MVVSLVMGTALAAAAAAHVAASPAGPTGQTTLSLPTLPWTPRSDWIDVRAHGAKGDGVTDDTAAIQTALSLVASCQGGPEGANANRTASTVFLPAGTYQLTRPLYVERCTGLTLVGTGATTVLRWHGPSNGTMFISNGTVFGSWSGLVWDGMGQARWGISYNSTHSLFETRQLHRFQHFKGFTDAGISVGVTYDGIAGLNKKEVAEALVQDCIFEGNHKGIGLQDYNDYDWSIDGCTFVRNDYGVYSPVHRDSNWDVHNCRFEQSAISDLTIGAPH